MVSNQNVLHSAPAWDRPLLQEHRRDTETFLRRCSGFSWRESDDIHSRLTLAELEPSWDQSRLQSCLWEYIYIYRGVQTLALAEMAHRDGAAFSFSLWITNTFILFSQASYLSGDWLWWSCRWRLSLCFIELVHHLFSETLDFFFLSLRVYYSFRLICILIWELFAFLLLDTEQIVTQEAYESRLTPITLPPNKNNHFPSNYETEQLAACSLGPGGRQHHYLHRFDYAAAGRVTLSALESNVCWLCIMSKSEAERLLFKSHVTH